MCVVALVLLQPVRSNIKAAQSRPGLQAVTTLYSDCPLGYSSSFGQQRRHAVALRRRRGCVAAGCAAGSCCSSHINGSTAQGHPDSLGPLCVGTKGMGMRDVAWGARQIWQHFLPGKWFLPPVTVYVCVWLPPLYLSEARQSALVA